jgi:hypothetical protein
MKCVSVCSATFVCNTSHSKKQWARYDHKCIVIFKYGTRYSSHTLMKTEFSRHVFEKYSNIKFHHNPSSGSRVIQCGQTDMTKAIVLFAILQTRLKMDILYNIYVWWQHEEEPTEQASQMITQGWLRHTAIITLRELSLITKKHINWKCLCDRQFLLCLRHLSDLKNQQRETKAKEAGLHLK